MSSSHHDEHHDHEKKPVAFTVPLIFALAVVFILLMFLSLCDPKAHHDAHSDPAHTHEAVDAVKEEAPAAETTQPVATDSSEVKAEAPAHH